MGLSPRPPPAMTIKAGVVYSCFCDSSAAPTSPVLPAWNLKLRLSKMTNEELSENFATHQAKLKVWQTESDARWQELNLNAQQLDDRYQKWKAESDARWQESDARWQESDARWQESDARWQESDARWQESETRWQQSETRWHSLDQRFLAWKETQVEINTEIEKNLQLISKISADTEIKLNRLIERFDNWIRQLPSRNGR